MPTAAKFPNAALALADVGGELVGITDNEWTVATAVTAAQAAPFSLVVNEVIDALVPAAGWITTANNEILHYNAVNTGTKTFTIDLRAQQDAAVASAIDAGSWVGIMLTKQHVNQIVAEIIAMQTKLLVGDSPNLVLNSDFARRTVWGLAMPETFADTSGYVVVAGSGGVASNIFTATAANTEIAWCNQSFVWRDGRASAPFKAVATAGNYQLHWRISATDWVAVDMVGGSNIMQITKFVSSVASGSPSSAAVALTLNNWYWLEIEKQGATFIAKIYNTGGTVPGVTKASSTLAGTVTWVVADASVQVGAHISITSDQATAQWGGVATGNGGVYVETWLPESHPVTFSGTLGGQAIGYDESTDAGPLGKQWALRAYIPAASRTITLNEGNSARGNANPSTTYARSFYYKVSGLGGSGALASFYTVETDGAGSDVTVGATLDAGSATSWTRVNDTRTTAATARGWRPSLNINNGSTATGTVFISLIQLEQGSVVTAWRNAPADDAGGSLTLRKTTTTTTTSASLVEVDSRDLAANIFLSRDATVRVSARLNTANSGAATAKFAIYVDGAIMGGTTLHSSDALGATAHDVSVAAEAGLAAGKHRIAVLWATTAGTQTLNVTPDALMEIAWTVGK